MNLSKGKLLIFFFWNSMDEWFNFLLFFVYFSEIEIDLPKKTRDNGTLILFTVLALDDGKDIDYKTLHRDGPTVIQRIKLTEYMIPRAATFNLLGNNDKPKTSSNPKIRPVSHLKSKVYITILTDNITFSGVDVPPELARLIRANNNHEFLPIIQNDFLRSRLTDLIEINKTMAKSNVEFLYNPVGIGKLRLISHVEHALQSLNDLGFTAKDVDEVKGIFSDTNVYLLCGTFFIGCIHVSINLIYQILSLINFYFLFIAIVWFSFV